MKLLKISILAISILSIGFTGCGGESSSPSSTSTVELNIDNSGELSNGIGYIGNSVLVGAVTGNKIVVTNIAHQWTTYTDETNTTIYNKIDFKDDGSYCIDSSAPFGDTWDCNALYSYGVNKEGTIATDEENTKLYFETVPNYDDCLVVDINNTNSLRLMCW